MKQTIEDAGTVRPVKKEGCGVAFLILFLFPFSAVGIGIAGLSYYRSVEWLAMQAWDEVPATLSRIALVESDGDGSDSYSLEAEYSYEIAGVVYRGERATLFAGSDNISDFHQRWYDKLKPETGVQGGVVCYVDASRPDKSVLIRDARWEMFVFFSVFALVFGLVGVIGIFVLVSTARESRFVARRREVSPYEPWTWRPVWIGEEIVPENRGWAGNVRIVICWVVMSVLPAGFFSSRAVLQGELWAITGMIIPAIGAGLVMVLFIWNRRAALPGKARLKLSEIPVVPGVDCVAAVVFESTATPEDDAECELVCTKWGKPHEPKEDNDYIELYKHTDTISKKECAVVSEQLCIPVVIHIPVHGKETSFDQSDIAWKLTVSFPVGGRKTSRTFLLPVFRQGPLHAAPDKQVV